MKQEFAYTKNVKRFVAAVNAIVKAPPGIDRMALVYGITGLGKTKTALWYWNQHLSQGAVYVRTKKLQNGRWLLGEIVAEMGEDPMFRTEDRFRQAVELLIGTDRVVLLDEIDYLAHDSKIVETIRDLHDICGNPWVFVGMERADRKLKRFSHLWRRFSQKIKFEPLDREDVAAVMAQICEVPIANDVPDWIMRNNGDQMKTSDLYRWAQLIEWTAKKQNIQSVPVAALEGGANGRAD